MKFSRETLLYMVVVASVSWAPFGDAFAHASIRLRASFVQVNTGSNYLEAQSKARKASSARLWSQLDDDDEEDEDDSDVGRGPLSKGVDSVSWLPTVVGAKGDGNAALTQMDSEIMPLFPLGGIVYTPNSEHVLNIFEPRYRQMYTDILMNGTKRFVVCMSHPTEKGRFAQTGVLFELEDLKEVSEQTADQIKYICNHRVTGRVKLHCVVNPDDWESRDTYLRVEGTVMDDSGKKGKKKEEKEPSNDIYNVLSGIMPGNPKEERALRDSFADLIDIQHDLEEDVRFTRASVVSLATKSGSGEDGLWQTIRLWQSFADQRLMARQNELQRDFQEKLQAFLKKEKGLNEEELPSAIGFQDLSPQLQQEVQELQQRMAIELQPLVLESTLTMQKLLEAEDHTERLQLVRYFIEAETKRLTTKKALQGMFSGETAASSDSSLPAEEQLSEEEANESASSKPSNFFSDEPDAFQ